MGRIRPYFGLLSLLVGQLVNIQAFAGTVVTPRKHAFPKVFYRDRPLEVEAVVLLAVAPPPLTDPHIHHERHSILRGMDVNMIRNICLSQVVLATALSTASWASGWTLGHLTVGTTALSLSFSPTSLLQGLFTAVPLVSVSYLMDRLPYRAPTHLKVSSSTMVLQLFGRRNLHGNDSSVQNVLIVASLMTALASIVEELIFRAYLPKALHFCWTPSLVWMIPALLFGLTHTNASQNPSERWLVGSTQFVQGLWLFHVLMVANGNLVTCMVAHCLTDLHVLLHRWYSINKQLDWADLHARMEYPEWNHLTMSARDALAHCFYSFDSQQQGRLSLDDVQHAVAYAFLPSDDSVPLDRVKAVFFGIVQDRPIDAVGPLSLTFPEFVSLLQQLQATTNRPSSM